MQNTEKTHKTDNGIYSMLMWTLLLIIVDTALAVLTVMRTMIIKAATLACYSKLTAKHPAAALDNNNNTNTNNNNNNNNAQQQNKQQQQQHQQEQLERNVDIITSRTKRTVFKYGGMEIMAKHALHYTSSNEATVWATPTARNPEIDCVHQTLAQQSRRERLQKVRKRLAFE